MKSFADDLSAHGGAPSTQLEQVCCDMSPAFIAGIEAYLAEQPEQDDGGEEVPAEGAEAAATDGGSADVAAEGDEDAPTLHRPEIVFDRYHVVAKANEAIDEVRRGEQKTRPELKRSHKTERAKASSLATTALRDRPGRAITRAPCLPKGFFSLANHASQNVLDGSYNRLERQDVAAYLVLSKWGSSAPDSVRFVSYSVAACRDPS